MPRILIDQVQQGMRLSRPITNDAGLLLFSEGTILTETHINRLKEMGLTSIYVEGDNTPKVPLEEALKNIEERFSLNREDPLMIMLKRALIEYTKNLYQK